MPGSPRSALASPLALALGASAVLLWLYGAIDPLEHYQSGIRYYWPMAEAAPALDLRQARPYVFRPLGPWLAGVTPLPEPLAFYVWSLAGSLGSLLVLAALLRREGVPERAVALSVLLLAANPYLLGFNVYNHFHLGDVLAQLALGGVLLALGARRYGVAGGIAAAAVLAREPAVLAIPVAAVWLAQQRRVGPDGLRAALAFVPVAMLFVAPRLWLADIGGPGLAQTFANASGKAADPLTWYRLLVNAWTPAAALLAIFPGEAWAYLRERLHLVALFGLVLASAFFGGDQERLMQPAVWAVYLPVGAVVARRVAGHRWAEGVLVGAAVLHSLHHITARFPLPDARMKAALALVALGATAALALRLRRPSPAARPRSSPS